MIVQTRLWAGAYDLSGDVQGLSFESTVEQEDDTVMTDDTRTNEPALSDFAVQHEGVWSAGTGGEPDGVLYTNLGLADVLATIAPNGAAVGDLAYFMRTSQGEYSVGDEVGTLLRFSVSLRASGGLNAVRGTLMVNSNLAASGSSTGEQLGSVSGTQSLFAGLHVLSASGSSPTLDVDVESDDNSGFTTPVTRISFAQATAIGSEWATPVGGAITDDWWRINYTIGGTGSPNFDAVVVVGIQ